MKHVGYYTKEQIRQLLASWQIDEPLPKKGKYLLVVFQLPRDSAKITWSPHTSPNGKRLFELSWVTVEDYREGEQFYRHYSVPQTQN